ncbi:MAG: exo-alpha-sialidase, partial [Clostridia bacterium]|nr:exo-alpha-sialidase [Clostridia bacterium]
MTDRRPAPGRTEEQPFPPGTGGSAHFRIPALVTLADGSLVAACDARWDHWGDGGGLDTVVSVSRDGGRSWSYSFPNHLGDNGNCLNDLSTAFIDPALATDGKRLWMLVDLYPAGIALNTARYRPVPGGSGFDSRGCLRLRARDPIPMGEEGYAKAAAEADYGYRLDLGTLELRDSAGTSPEGWTVSPFFDITDPQGRKTNLFCADAPFHPYPTGYLYLTWSDDGGRTWSAPELPDLKRKEEEVLLVGPGAGAVRGDHLIFSAYGHTLGFERACLIWRDGDGWHRSEDAT